jgi:hypothetical protein
MQFRTLQTIDGLGPSASNTVILAVPVELMETVKGVSGYLKGLKDSVHTAVIP